MLVDYDNAPHDVPDFEDLSLPRQIAVLLNLDNVPMSRRELLKKDTAELVREYNMHPEDVIALQSMIIIGEHYHRTRIYEERLSGMDSKMVAKFFREEWMELHFERLVFLFFDDEKNLREILEYNGVINEASYDEHEIAASIRKHEAKYLMLVHNHPSGRVKPSKLDIQTTRDLMALSKDWSTQGLPSFEVFDHVIVGQRKYFSFAESEMLEELHEELEM